jgi:hypothetical protein
MSEETVESTECDSGESRTSTPDKVPMSETFRRVLEQFNVNSDTAINSLDCLDGLGHLKQDGHVRYEHSDDLSRPPPAPPKGRRASVCVGQIQSEKPITGHRIHRRKSVQWIDERFIVPLAHEPSPEEKHAARIFMKTVPKSILKNSLENISSADHHKMS